MAEHVDFSGAFIDVAVRLAMRFDVEQIRDAIRRASRLVDENHPGSIRNPSWTSTLGLGNVDPPELTYGDAVLDYILDYNFPLNSTEAKVLDVASLLAPLRAKLVRFYSGFQSFNQRDVTHVLYMQALYEAVTLITNKKVRHGVKAVFSPMKRLITVSKRLEVPCQID